MSKNENKQPSGKLSDASTCSVPVFAEMNKEWKLQGGYYVGKDNDGVYRSEELEVSVWNTDLARIDVTLRDGESWLDMRERTEGLRERANEMQRMRASIIAEALNDFYA